MTLDQKLEAVLFYKAEPLSKAELTKLFSAGEAELENAIHELKNRLAGSGLALIITDKEIELATRPELDALIEELRKEEMKRDIGKAGAETLAIVLYSSPVSRSDIDRIRGVNSSYILRNLEMRGLIEKSTMGRKSEFRPTTSLLRHLGIGEKSELRGYAEVMDALEKFESNAETQST